MQIVIVRQRFGRIFSSESQPCPQFDNLAPQWIAPVTNRAGKNDSNYNRASNGSHVAVKKPPANSYPKNAADNQAAPKVRPEMPPAHVVIAFHLICEPCLKIIPQTIRSDFRPPLAGNVNCGQSQ
jgi:hypothetical protein